MEYSFNFYPVQVILFDLEQFQRICSHENLLLSNTVVEFQKFIKFLISSNIKSNSIMAKAVVGIKHFPNPDGKLGIVNSNCLQNILLKKCNNLFSIITNTTVGS